MIRSIIKRAWLRFMHFQLAIDENRYRQSGRYQEASATLSMMLKIEHELIQLQ